MLHLHKEVLPTTFQVLESMVTISWRFIQSQVGPLKGRVKEKAQLSLKFLLIGLKPIQLVMIQPGTDLKMNGNPGHWVILLKD